MEINNLEFLSQKKIPTFNSIEEYESYLSEMLNDSLSVFTNFLRDYDVFRKIISNQEDKNEVNISQNFRKILGEIKQSPACVTKMAKNSKIFQEEKGKTKYEKKRVHYYFCKENGTNFAVTEILNPFEQREIPNELTQPRFFSKKSEVKSINELICLKIRNILHEKFQLAFDEGVENERWTKEGIEIQNKEKDKIEEKVYDTFMRRKIVNNATKRLYPKPETREGISDKFYIDKINEYNNNGKYLSKKVNFQKLFKELKIQPKEDFKGDPINDLKLTDDIIKEYQEEKGKNNTFKNKSKINSKNEEDTVFIRGELFFDKNDLLITKSKMYIKVDRKDKFKNFKILGEPLNNKSKFYD